MRNGQVSFWQAELGVPLPRAPLPCGRRVDVCIVGAGFTGLWTALYLKRARPELSVVVLEREFAGFGASGRNGGWLSAHFAGRREAMARAAGREGVIALEHEMRRTVDEVIAVAREHGIEAGIRKTGVLEVARSPAQLARLGAELAGEAEWGIGEQDHRRLERDEIDTRVRVAGSLGGAFTPHAARVHPARLVRGLARAAERLGVVIHEGTEVTAVTPHCARTSRGDVRAQAVLVCLEGFSAGLPGRRRTWLPLNSAMIVTERLDEWVWASIGWEGAELLGDCAHAYMYAQRTEDGRIALGGRGVPYRFGSRTDARGRTQRRTIVQLAGTLHDMFPAARQARIEHAWCGVLGVPRDWTPSAGLDLDTGIGWAGGYVGNGVAAANLAGRTLRDLVLGEPTALTGLPWVGHQARDWEPEPWRFLGARLVYGLYRAADRREARGTGARSHPLAAVAGRLAGR